jgi:hypothetical protein
VHAHVYRITLLEFEAGKQEDQQETQQQKAPEEGEPMQEELPEYPDHKPASFLKDKPQSILSLLYFYKY